MPATFSPNIISLPMNIIYNPLLQTFTLVDADTGNAAVVDADAGNTPINTNPN